MKKVCKKCMKERIHQWEKFRKHLLSKYEVNDSNDSGYSRNDNRTVNNALPDNCPYISTTHQTPPSFCCYSHIPASYDYHTICSKLIKHLLSICRHIIKIIKRNLIRNIKTVKGYIIHSIMMIRSSKNNFFKGHKGADK